MANNNLNGAKKSKSDEFYTQMADIEKEMVYYRAFFENKIVLCNCDDPYESNFFKYFALNFNFLKLKKLIATCYGTSPVAYTQLTLFDIPATKNQPENHADRKPYKIEITEVIDTNGDGATDLSDVEYLIQNDNNVLTLLKGDGDFRSDECIEILKEADIVVTNPPFSLFREYVAQLFKYDKKFIILGNQNALSYKEIFPFIMHNQIWLGHSIHNGDREFRVPNDYDVSKNYRYDNEGNKYVRVRGPRWFTNIDYGERHEDLILYRKYSPELYPKYDNYEAINVDATADIPLDYDGIMGVPITFMDKYNPDQFEIVGLSQKYGFGLESTKFYDDYWELRQDGTKTGSSGKKTNGNPVMPGIPDKNNYYYNGKEYVYSLYSRIFIKRRNKDGN